MKGCTRGDIGSSTKIKSTINYKLIEERQNDQYKRYSVFDYLQYGSKQESVAIMVCDLAL